MKMNLYIDFDGVILNSIEVSYQMMREKYGKKITSDESTEFYKNINWNDFLKMCTPINNSIENLQKLIDSDMFDVAVLTHVLSESESDAKQKYLQECLPGIKCIPVTKPKQKWESVVCENAILVDDYSENLLSWKQHGGIPVKFSLKNKEYEYITIRSLDELIRLYPLFLENESKMFEKVKKLKA